MAYLENGIFCSAEEYRNGLSQRVQEGSLEQGAFYTMLLRLDATERDAAKLAILPSEISFQKSGMAVVKFAFLDADFQPLLEREEIMQDGLISSVKETSVVDGEKDGARYGIEEAYLKNYSDGPFDDFLAQTNSLEAVR